MCVGQGCGEDKDVRTEKHAATSMLITHRWQLVFPCSMYLQHVACRCISCPAQVSNELVVESNPGLLGHLHWKRRLPTCNEALQDSYSTIATAESTDLWLARICTRATNSYAPTTIVLVFHQQQKLHYGDPKWDCYSGVFNPRF